MKRSYFFLLNCVLNILLQNAIGKFILIDVKAAIKEGAASRSENKVNNDSKEIVESCLRYEGISDACVEFVKTGKMENDKCLKECSNNGCIEKLKECLDKIGLEKMQEISGNLQEGIEGFEALRLKACKMLKKWCKKGEKML